MPDVETDTARQSVLPPTCDESLDTVVLTTAQPSPSKDTPPEADKDTMIIPQQPMPPPTNTDATATKDGHGAGSPSLQQPDASLPRGDGVPMKTHRQSTLSQDGSNETSETVERHGAVDTILLQVKFSGNLPISKNCMPDYPPEQSSNCRSANSALKTHTSGLCEPDIDSLLEFIRKDEGFEEESKPQREKFAEAIVAVRNASQSQEWSNLLRGAIILTTCLEFPKGDVRVTCIQLCD